MNIARSRVDGGRPAGSRLAAQVAGRRRRQGWTQRELAGLAGVSVATIRDLEQGRTDLPGPALMTRLGRLLETDLSADPHRGRFTIGVLGPLELASEGRPVPIRSAKQRTLLGLLALHPNQVVGRGAIVDAIWGPATPAAVGNAVQVQVSRLRRRLTATGAERVLLAVYDGYRLRVDDTDSDLLAFRGLTARAARMRDDAPAQACALYAEALGLWRGNVITDVEALCRCPTAVAIGHERLTAVLDLADAAAAADRHATALPFLYEAAAGQPLHGGLHARLMIALAATGQQAAALDLYTGIRRRLADELGVDPDPALADAYLRIVRQQVIVAAGVQTGAPTAESTADPTGGPPRQLPASIRYFTGRAAALRALDALREPAATGETRVAVVSGSAGVGKTTLVVHWANLARDAFPDGQLHANLRGYDAHAEPVAPDEVIRYFLEALGVPASRIPAGEPARAALYRSELARRKLLVVLDNARDAAQVRPLLPGPGTAAVVVTGRSDLSGLVVDGAQALRLGLLTRAEARDLLARRLGAGRLAAHPAAADTIIDRCARLPLALAVVAARAVLQPQFPLDAFADDLADTLAAGRLDAFVGDDAGTDVRTVFACSYRILSPGAATLFRRMALHPGPDLDAPAAAAVCGVPPDEARRLLAELTRAHLADQHRPGRYELHDLLRAFALELLSTVDGPDRDAAFVRMLDHYTHTAFAADRRVNGSRDALTLTPPAPGSGPRTFADSEEALRWFGTEVAVLLRLVRQAADAGADRTVRQLAWTMGTHLDRSGRWSEQLAVQELARAAAARTGDRSELARVHRLMARSCVWLGRFDDAADHHGQALEISAALGDRIGCGHTHINHAWALEQQDRYAEALDHAERALTCYRSTGHIGEAAALNSVGWYHARLGDHRAALEYCTAALALHRRGSDRSGTAATLDSLGYAHHHLGDHARALRRYHEALEIYRTTGDRFYQATIWQHIAVTLRAGDDAAGARTALAEALSILDDLSHPAATDVRMLLDRG